MAQLGMNECSGNKWVLDVTIFIWTAVILCVIARIESMHKTCVPVNENPNYCNSFSDCVLCVSMCGPVWASGIKYKPICFTATKPGSVCLYFSFDCFFYTRATLCSVILCFSTFHLLVVMIRLSVPIQVLVWKDLSAEWL